MVNPVINYHEEMKYLSEQHKDSTDRYIYLQRKCKEDCTHTNKEGNVAWRELTDDIVYCPYCGLNQY